MEWDGDKLNLRSFFIERHRNDWFTQQKMFIITLAIVNLKEVLPVAVTFI